MVSTSETGHAKNAANFDDLISSVTGYGTAYNPSKATIKLTALQTLSTSAKTLVRKIQGSRATAKKTEEEIATEKAEGKETKEISSSQMSYDSRLDNFDKLIKLLTSVTLYAPNEADLKVTALTTIAKAKTNAE